MSTPYVTFPGTDWAFTDDVNLLDADTAHLQQSKGLHDVERYQFAASTLTTPLAGAAPFGTTVLQSVTNSVGTFGYVGTGKTVAVAAETQYTLSWSAITDTASRTSYTNIAFFQADASTEIFPSDSSSAGAILTTGFTRLSHTFTTPPLCAFLRVRITYGPVAGDFASGETFQFGAVHLGLGTSSVFVRSLRIVGDLDVRASVAAADWTPAAAEILLDQYVAGTGGYRLGIETSGAISLVAHGATGAISESSSLFTLTDGEATEIRITMDASAGDLTWYQDNVEVDDDTYTAQALKPAGLDLYVGALSTDASHFNGDIYWLEVRDGIGGPVVARFDAADIAAVLP